MFSIQISPHNSAPGGLSAGAIESGPVTGPLSYADLTQALRLSRDFNQSSSSVKGDYLSHQFQDFEESVRDVPGCLGVFATGYPFYATRADGEVVPVEEISRYIGAIEDKSRLASKKDLGSWACSTCQRANQLPDLKTFCRPCELTQVKPREIFKALPDLDFWVILSQANSVQERAVQAAVNRAGFFQSDADIDRGVRSTIAVTSALNDERVPDERLPIDLHIVTKEQLLDAMTEVRRVAMYVYRPGDITEDNEVSLSPRSLRVSWEMADQPYDFMKDFLFSFTVKEIADVEIIEAIEATKAVIRESLCLQDIFDLIATYPKEMRQLQSPEVADILRSKWEPIT